MDLCCPVSDVTFQQFIRNLLSNMDLMPRLKPLRSQLLTAIARYDDCMRTCEIPFTKRQPTTWANDISKKGHSAWNNNKVDKSFWNIGSIKNRHSILKNIPTKRSPSISSSMWTNDLTDLTMHIPCLSEGNKQSGEVLRRATLSNAPWSNLRSK